tara:strand:- start:113 stop:406 length:294 start_codon:yes stop_codon:yes gene_type:complete
MTWREKRKEAYLRTHSRTPRSPGEEDEPSGSGDTAAASSTSDDASTPSSTPRGEKSFAQKRKEAILRRQGRLKPTETDIGVTSVLFAAKMKRLSSKE